MSLRENGIIRKCCLVPFPLIKSDVWISFCLKTGCDDWVQYADIDTPSGIDDVVESTRLNVSQLSTLRPNITSNISNIPRSSLLNGGASNMTNGASEVVPSELELSRAVHSLDISDEEIAAADKTLSHVEEQGQLDDVFPPPKQTAEEMANALEAAIGEESLDHDRSNLEANIMLKSHIDNSNAALTLKSNLSNSEKSTSSSKTERSQRSHATRSISITSDISKERPSQCSSTTGSQSSQQSSQEEFFCPECGKKCKKKSGLKSHMRTHNKQ